MVLLLAAPAGCGRRTERVTAAQGVVWDRISPPEAVDADRPDWASDSLAFQVRVAGAERVAVSRADGSGLAIQPQTGSVRERAPRWVGPGLLVLSSDASGTEDLWYREPASGVTRRLTDEPSLAWTPAPRPGTPGLAYVEGPDSGWGRIALLPDTAMKPLGKVYLTPTTLVAGEPSWNPAGDRLCFSVKKPSGSIEVWTLSMADTLPVELTVAPLIPIPQLDRSPRFSPDGTSILMASNRGGVWGVWKLSLAGEAQGLDLLAQDVPGAEIRHPTWSPDGTEIVLSSDRGGARALWRLSRLPF